MNIRRSIVRLALASVIAVASFGGVATADSIPFKTLRVVINPNGSLFLAGAGLTVTHPSAGHYHVAFATGTWKTVVNNLTTPCFFLPQVQPLFTTSAVQITGYSTLGDGSGSIDVTVMSGVDVSLAMVFTSGNC
jgi:hypothetical protein